MPVSIRKTPRGRFTVRTHPPGEKSHLKAKATSKKKAEAQARLLHAVDHGWRPTGKPAHESAEWVVEQLLCREAADEPDPDLATFRNFTRAVATTSDEAQTLTGDLTAARVHISDLRDSVREMAEILAEQSDPDNEELRPVLRRARSVLLRTNRYSNGTTREGASS